MARSTPLATRLREITSEIRRMLAIVRKAEDALFTQEAMFPRYLFFRPAHAQQSISVVRSTLGITSLVRFGHEFAQLPHDKLRQIAQWAEQQQERSAAELMGLQPGTAVKVTAGPLAGLDALAPLGPGRVLIHDAARPFVSAAVIDRVLAALDSHAGAIAALPLAAARPLASDSVVTSPAPPSPSRSGQGARAPVSSSGGRSASAAALG